MSIDFALQVQPNLVADFDLEFIYRSLEEAGAEPTVSGGAEPDEFMNFSFSSTNPGELWAKLKPQLMKSNSFTEASILCCQGQQGWDDYLLLYHFDKGETLDEI